MGPLKSLAVIASLVLSGLAVPCNAAPGPFELSASGGCFSYSPAIFISWTSSSGATRYEVLRDGQPYTLKKSNSPNGSVLYDDDVVTGGPAHSYAVRASDGGPVTTDSNTVTVAVTFQCASAPPAAFTISGKPFCAPGAPQHSPTPGVYLSWNGAKYASHFDIYRDGAFVFRLQAFEDQILYDYQAAPVSGGSFTYVVVAENPLGKSTSNSVVLSVPPDICVTQPPPPAAGPFTVSANGFCNNRTPAVHLQWSPSANVDSYLAYRNGNIIASLPAAITSFDDTAALSDGSYSYFLRGIAQGGAVFSNSVTIDIDSIGCTQQMADLVASDIVPSSLIGRAGERLTVSIVVQNRGGAAASATTARVRFGRGTAMLPSNVLLSTIALPAIDAGAAIERSVTVTLPPFAAGTYGLFLSVDEEHVSADARVENNVKASTAFTLGDMIPPKRRAATH